MTEFTPTVEKCPEFDGTLTFELLSNDEQNDSEYRMVNGQKYYPIFYKDFVTPGNSVIVDKSGKTIALRYLNNSEYITLVQQKKQNDIDAYIKYPSGIRKDIKFEAGFCTPKTKQALEYLWYSPFHNLYEGHRISGVYPMFRVYNANLKASKNGLAIVIQTKVLNKLESIFNAANNFEGINEPAARELNLLLFGANELYEGHNEVFNKCAEVLSYYNENNTKDVEVILNFSPKLEKGETLDELTVVIGTALQKGIISISEKKGEVSKKVNGKWTRLYYTDIEFEDSAEIITPFSSWLNSSSGDKSLRVLKEEIKD